MTAIEARALRKEYGPTVALHGLDLEVRPGELVGLLGPNGAGKSTFVKMVCGLVRPTSGTLTAEPRKGYLAELFRFPDWCTADELLALHQELAPSDGGTQERSRLLARVGLEGEARRRVGTMSKGMQQRLGLAQALIGDPRLLLLDEPTSALDPAGRRLVRSLLEELRAEGRAVLLNSHLLSEVELVCDRVAIVARGKLVAAGTPGELSRPAGVEVDTAQGVRRFPAASRDDVPAIVADLVAAGERIYGVRILRSSLEDAYLAAVEGAG